MDGVPSHLLDARCGVWGLQHRPKTFEELDYHPHISEWLQLTVQNLNFSHMIFVGPPGSGKRTRIHALLRHLFGTKVDQYKVDTYKQDEVAVPMIHSPVHTEIDLSSEGARDRLVIEKVVSMQQGVHKGIRVVVLYNANHLSIEAQSALRRKMEECVAVCKIFFVCHDTAGIILPIQGRCARIRIPSPSVEEIRTVLAKTWRKQQLGELSARAQDMIGSNCGRDLTRALWMLQASHAVTLGEDLVPLTEPWRDFCDEVVHDIMSGNFSQKPKYGDKIASESVYDKLYELLKSVPPEVILLELRDGLAKTEFFRDLSERSDLYRTCSQISAEVLHSTTPILHLTAFVTHVVAQVWSQSRAIHNRQRVVELRAILQQ